MKTKRFVLLTVLLFGVVLACEAQASYNPSAGRWLSSMGFTDPAPTGPQRFYRLRVR